MTRWNRLWVLLLVLVPTVGCDQATKQLAVARLAFGPARSYLGGVFRLSFAENEGAFLSLGAWLPERARFWLFVVAVGLLLVGLLLYLALAPALDRLSVASLALVLGGGASNWIDRAFNDGRVVDFMNLGIGPVRTGIFNVADVAIMVGVGLMFFVRKPPAPSPPSEPAPGT